MLSGFIQYTYHLSQSSFCQFGSSFVCFLYVCWTFVLVIVLPMLSWVTLRLLATVKQVRNFEIEHFSSWDWSQYCIACQFEAGVTYTKRSIKISFNPQIRICQSKQISGTMWPAIPAGKWEGCKVATSHIRQGLSLSTSIFRIPSISESSCFHSNQGSPAVS